MVEHSPQELEIRELVQRAAESASTNPWGPAKNKLAQHAGSGKIAGLIGIQDSTVIDRAIGSPGMLKALDVHGFVVKKPADRTAADLETVEYKLREQIRVAPFISTAVVFSYTNEFFPTHILSSAPDDVGGHLAALYPNAQSDLTLSKEAGTTDAAVPRGPWRVMTSEISVTSSGIVVATLDDLEDEARYLASGDAVVLVDPDTSAGPIGVGRLHHVRPTHRGDIQLVFDRYKALSSQE